MNSLGGGETLIKRLYKHVRKDHHTSSPENENTLHERPGNLVHRRIADYKPEGEEGDGEEVPEEDHGALDETTEETDGAFVAAEFEIAEAAALEGTELFIYLSLVSDLWMEVLEGKGVYHLRQKEHRELVRGY